MVRGSSLWEWASSNLKASIHQSRPVQVVSAAKADSRSGLHSILVLSLTVSLNLTNWFMTTSHHYLVRMQTPLRASYSSTAALRCTASPPPPSPLPLLSSPCPLSSSPPPSLSYPLSWLAKQR
ncbi:hypothetical protein NXS19_011383 [Fusarium pseudograminearum]|nr:hypothetical protein NXS19_011383 [Fusarium pseudograminearum]